MYAAGSTPEGQPESGHSPALDAPKRPVWSRKLGRVDCSVWRHQQPGGARYTISITRSYLSKRDGQWKRDSYFDVRDQGDVRILSREAEHIVLGLMGDAGEDDPE